MEVYYIEELPIDDIKPWHQILRWAMGKSTAVEFARIGKMAIGVEPPEEPFYSYKSTWMRQVDRGHPITFERFYLTEAMQEFLLNSGNLSSWIGTSYEEPAFYNEEEVVMYTQCSGQVVFARLSEDELRDFRSKGFAFDKAHPYSHPTRPSGI